MKYHYIVSKRRKEENRWLLEMVAYAVTFLGLIFTSVVAFMIIAGV
jgi:hypothetical protein